jgi:hypothetical protein
VGSNKPPIQWVTGALNGGGYSDRGLELTSPPAGGGVRGAWISVSTAPCGILAWYVVKDKNSFALTLTLLLPVRVAAWSET